ncbi:nitrilase [soil metagenome]
MKKSSRRLRIAYYQFRPLFGQTENNLQKVLSALAQAEADLIVLPELPFTGYYFRDRAEVLALAEDPARSNTVEGLVELCRRRDFYLVTGFCERRNEKVYNSALLLGPEGVAHVYRKLHLFNEEKRYFDAGDLPLVVHEVRGVKIGLMVCFDWAFPEVARVLAIHGAEILCHPANLVLAYCQQAMAIRCLENRVFAVTANRFGNDHRPHGRLRFTGKSQIVAPSGRALYRAHAQREELGIVEIDLSEARDKSITPLNDVIADRRPNFYETLYRPGPAY